MEGEGHCTVGLEGGLVTLCQIETHGVMQTIVHSVMLSGHSVASMSKNIYKTFNDIMSLSYVNKMENMDKH